MIAFTGGEPFLLGAQLVEAVSESASRGLVTRVVTSAYWATTPDVAEKKLRALYGAGLQELSISWDDFHEEFVSFDRIHNAFWAGKQLGIRVAINIVQARDSKWTAARVRQKLGLPSESNDVVVESPLNLTGRAASELSEAGLRPMRLLGPCPYVLTGPTLSAKNKLLACCGVIPDTEALTLDADFKPENLSSSIERGLKSPLLNWIHLRGPYAVMEWICQRFGIPLVERTEIGGNCEACRRLFETREIVERIPEALAERSDEIAAEIQVLHALGMLDPKSIVDLWREASTVVDTGLLPTESHTPTNA